MISILQRVFLGAVYLVLGQQRVADTRQQHHGHQERYRRFGRHGGRVWSLDGMAGVLGGRQRTGESE